MIATARLGVITERVYRFVSSQPSRKCEVAGRCTEMREPAHVRLGTRPLHVAPRSRRRTDKAAFSQS